MDPVILEVVPGSRVYVPQRSFRTDKQREGIETALTDLWEAGVLELSDSHWNTPLNPVPKPDGTFRPAHDLRKVNEVTTTPLLPVPDPHKCLSVLTPEMKYFTVIDLKHAFFTIPLAEECRYQFAFTYGGVKLQYKVLPQGHRNSPGIFNKVLKDCFWGPCGGSSAQFAELMALKLALEVASGQRVTIYTDSAYVCGLVLRDLSSWKRNGFLTAKGTPIAHKELFKRLKLALYEVCKNVGKTPGENLVIYCNEAGIVLVKMRGAVPDQH
uniref:RNase H type-1 domain-containing protein n=1 Tax=Neogobius melanostomus TaxID=47308 RepID=A0A8C6S8M2_9GOBI